MTKWDYDEVREIYKRAENAEERAEAAELKVAALEARIITLCSRIYPGDPGLIPRLEGQVAAAKSELEKRNNRLDLVAHLHQQRKWSLETFGPAPRPAGVVDHIERELKEVRADPHDLYEWIDIIILAFDGAWRQGWTPEQIVDALATKQAINEKRKWPDWRTMSEDEAIEHVKE